MSVDINEILSFLDKTNVSESFMVFPSTIEKQRSNSLMWAKNISKAEQVLEGVLILSEEIYQQINPVNSVLYIQVPANPRLYFLRVLEQFFSVDRSAEIKNHVNDHRSNEKLLIGENVFIGSNVVIGDGTIIHDNCTIFKNSVIGEFCLIKSFTSIGTEGLGFEFIGGKWEKFPQIGNVIIGDHCEIGPHATVRRSALGTTSVGNGCKIGSFTNIGHNCSLGKSVLITSNCTIAGSCNIGDNCYLGISTSIRNGISIGPDSFIGMGSVVVKNVPKQSKVFGNPAKPQPK